MSNTVQTIQVDSAAILNLTNAILPVLETLSPAVAGNANNIQLGISAANALLPLLSLIPTNSGLITAEEQIAQMTRLEAILSLGTSGPEWVKQT